MWHLLRAASLQVQVQVQVLGARCQAARAARDQETDTRRAARDGLCVSWQTDQGRARPIMPAHACPCLPACQAASGRPEVARGLSTADSTRVHGGHRRAAGDWSWVQHRCSWGWEERLGGGLVQRLWGRWALGGGPLGERPQWEKEEEEEEEGERASGYMA